MTEIQKIREILNGNTAVYGYFVDNYQDMAFTIAYRICNNKEEAEDVVQTSFVKAFHNLKTFKKQAKFSSWFYRIVYNTALTHLKKEEKLKEYFEYGISNQDASYSEAPILNTISADEQTAIINQSIGQLHPLEATIITLYYIEELAVKEIVKITGLSAANVKIKLFRGRKNLKLILEKKGIFY